MYARNIGLTLVSIVIVALLMFLLIYSAPTRAGLLDTVMVMDNEDGGKIVLTLAPCDVTPGAPVAGVYGAYATDKDGGVHFGCWIRRGVTVDTEWVGEVGVYTYAAHLFRMEPAEKVK